MVKKNVNPFPKPKQKSPHGGSHQVFYRDIEPELFHNQIKSFIFKLAIK